MELLDALAAAPLLITGAGGSIGSALTLRLAQTVHRRTPDHLVVVERCESNFCRLQQAFESQTNALPGNAPKAAFFLCDAGDRAALAEIFSAHRPRLVFHAAAYKHVPMLEEQPLAAIANNIFAAEAVASVAAESGARVLLLSTDKAVKPASVMGATKHVAEKIVRMRGGTVLRLGNVLGSSGSVSEVFAQQVAIGGPLTVTDPSARRFFFAMEEAVDLLLLAALDPVRGALLAPAQHAEYSIASLADFMARTLAPGREISIRYTGLRPGEKLAERLWDDPERPCASPCSSLLSIQSDLPVPAQFEAQLARLRTALYGRDVPAALRALCALVPGFQPSPATRALAGEHSQGVCA